jgi:tetratricopeptide (TPR) repeat protein
MLNVGLRRIPKDSASLYLARGILYVQMGDYDSSRRDFDKVEQLNPELEYGRGMQGLADLQKNNLSQAEKDVRNRLVKAPDDAFLWYLLAQTLLRKGAASGTPQFQEALHAAEKAVQLRSDFPLARNLLARLYLEEGRNEDAIQQSRLAFKADPNTQTGQTALYHLMTALRKSGKQDQIPPLAKKLAELREQARAKETAEHSYTLVEANPSAVNKQ